MENNPQSIDPRVRAAKRKLWIGVGVIIALGLLVVVYFLFTDTAVAPTITDTNTNAVVIDDASGDIYMTNTTPAAESVNEAIGSVSVTFSKPVNSDTVTEDNFYILQGIEDKVPGTLGLSADGLTATWDFTESYTHQGDGVTALTVYIDSIDMRGMEGEAVYIPGGVGTWNVLIAAAPTNAE